MAEYESDSKKSLKKLSKKLFKLRQNLKQKENILITDSASQILCICNGGLDNCVSYKEILELFGGSGVNCDVIMIPQKSYCFVCYESMETCVEACSRLNGAKLPPTESRKNEVTLYTLFVKEVPDCISPTNDLPPGLILLEDVVSDKDASEIMEAVNFSCEEHSVSQVLKHRRVKHYGYEFKYSINNVNPDEPLSEGVPVIFKPLLEHLIETNMIKHYPDQLTVNQYQPGQGIPSHVDTPSAFEDGLISLSLGSQVVMEFRHPDGRHMSVLLPPRSVLIMTGESRFTWSHGITPRKSDIVTLPNGGLTLVPRGVRTSFTFRKITGVRPSSNSSDKPNVPCDDSTASQLEKVHVYQVYEKIADHFSGTRHTPWPNIAEFLNQQPQGSLMADIGCGNGKYLGINKGLYEIASDRSFNLAQICQGRNFQVYVGDVLSIPLRHGIFDVCICIAVIHHLSTKERRQKAISEILKILQVGGKALIYVWAMEQELNQVKSKYLKKTKPDLDIETAGDDTTCSNDKVQHSRSENAEIALGEDDKVKKGDSFADNNVDKGTTDTDGESNSGGDCGRTCDTNIENEKGQGDLLSTGNNIEKSQKLHVHVNRTQFQQQDLLVPWQLKNAKTLSNGGNTFHRFYHVFTEGELEMLCHTVGNCRVLSSYYDQGNWAVVLEKI